MNGIPPSEIVAFTFTEKAAGELLARIHVLAQEKIPELNLNGLFIGTIHSWCFQYLLDKSEYYNFSPLDELHIDALVSRLYDFLGLEESYSLPYPKAIPKFLKDLEVFYNEYLSIENVPIKVRESISIFLNILKENRLLTFGGMIYDASVKSIPSSRMS